MLGAILQRNSFKTKCKTALGRTKTRLELIKNKRNAMQKFLKKDIADLLNNNHDHKAYGRAEGLYNEFNLSSCYDYVEQCCACVSYNLKRMQKERECPEECKAAVSSLIYAAARFADMPELRDLRSQFNVKYGSEVVPFVSKEFVEKMKSKPPTMEMKLQLMQEVAQEYSITWDSLPLQQHLHSLGTRSQKQEKTGKLSPRYYASGKMLRSMSSSGRSKEKQEEGSRLSNEGQTDKQRTRRHNSWTGFDEDSDEEWQEENNTIEENANRRPFTNRTVPAPYTMPNKAGELGSCTGDDAQCKEERNPNIEYGSENPRLGVYTHKEGHNDDNLFSKEKPRPRSVRTKFLKSSSYTTNRTVEREIDVKGSQSATVAQEKKNESFSDDEEQEEAARQLQRHYSSKRPPKTPTSSRRSLPASPEESQTPKSGLPPPPGRRRYLFTDSQSASPLRETDRQSSSESPVESRYSPVRHVKAGSHPEDKAFGHVHPKLPDYDKLADRVSALGKK